MPAAHDTTEQARRVIGRTSLAWGLATPPSHLVNRHIGHGEMPRRAVRRPRAAPTPFALAW